MKNLTTLSILSALILELYLLLNSGYLSQKVADSTTAPNYNNYPVELVTSWNQLILQTAVKEDGLLTLKGVRTASMAHIAMHDALQAIQPRYMPYTYDGDAPDADPVVSAAQAAYEVAVVQYPDEKEKFEQELYRWRTLAEDVGGLDKGIQLAQECAASILVSRENDLWNNEAEYNWQPPRPGVYTEFNEHSGTPEGFIFGTGWAKAKPFMLTAQSQFRSPPPPDINSHAYTEAFNEVKNLGSTHSESRTEDQTHLAMWCKDFIENSHNRLARALVVKEKLDLWEGARAFALMNMAIYDAYVNVFDNKFHYNHWRPYTAIRWAEHDGNPDTQPDSTWNNLHKHTYAFPSYPSAHGAASAAALTVLPHVLGTGNDYEFEMTTSVVDQAGPFSGTIEMKPPTRSFSSFSEAALTFSMSRVYLGIHFRYDSEAGNQLGRQIGEYAIRNFLRSL